MNITKLRHMIREAVEAQLDDEEFGPTNRPDQNVADFEGFRGYVANTLNGCGAHPSITTAITTCQVGDPVHDVLWNTWGFVEPECGSNVNVGIPYVEMGKALWPYADGMARDLGAIATEVGPDVIDVDDLSDRFCGALDCGEEPVEPQPFSGMGGVAALLPVGGDASLEDLFKSGVVDPRDVGEGEASVWSDDYDAAVNDADAFSDGDFGDDVDVDSLLDDEAELEGDEDVEDEGKAILDPLGYDTEEPEGDEDDEGEDDLDETFDFGEQTHCEVCGAKLDHGICNSCE